MGYLRLIPTVYVVLAAFGALFVVVATLLRAWLGARYVWAFWAVYLAAVSAACIYRLSGLQFGMSLPVAGHTLYLVMVAFVSVGLPLALGAAVITRTAGTGSFRSHLRHASQSWLVIVATTPVAVGLVAVVDYFNIAIISL